MKRKPFVAIWLNHREAFLFWANEQGEIGRQYLKSHYQEEAEPVERATQCAPGVIGPVFPHASVKRRRQEQLKKYYKHLVHLIQRAEEIYLFGHGPAKKELGHFLNEDRNLAGRLKGIETFERLTQPQMIAQVKKFFQLPRCST